MDMSKGGLIYLVVGWVTTVLVWVVFLMRIYSRTWITRSVGSDDFAIGVSVASATFGAALTTIQVYAGLGFHQNEISPHRYSWNEQWEFTGWLEAFVCYFFTRTSVMLFVLRLLPAYKKWQHKAVYFAFFLNFAITAVATVSFGVACIPFRALWTSESGAKCYSKELLVIVVRVNGILACVVDFITALIPALLLRDVRMRRMTRIVLDFIFFLGLATAALSIGRVATITKPAVQSDSSYRLMPAKWFAMMEEKFGVIIACLPSLRQLFAYRIRTGTFLPDKSSRQEPNEDFVKMRRRINLRDIFWYRKAMDTGGRVLDARPIFQTKIPLEANEPSPPPKTKRDGIATQAQFSAMDSWHHRVRNIFSSRASKPAAGNIGNAPPESKGRSPRKLFKLPLWLYSTPRNSSWGESSDREKLAGAQDDMTTSKREGRRIAHNYRLWGLLPGRRSGQSGGTTGASHSTRGPFLYTDSGADNSDDVTGGASRMSASGRNQDMSLMEALSNPVGSQMQQPSSNLVGPGQETPQSNQVGYHRPEASSNQAVGVPRHALSSSPVHNQAPEHSNPITIEGTEDLESKEESAAARQPTAHGT